MVDKLTVLVTGSDRIYVDDRLFENNEYCNPIISLSNFYLGRYGHVNNEDGGYYSIQKEYEKHMNKYNTSVWKRHREYFKKLLITHGVYSNKFYQEFFMSDIIRNRNEFINFYIDFDKLLQYESQWEGSTKEYRMSRIFFDFLLFECISNKKKKIFAENSTKYFYRRYIPELDDWLSNADREYRCDICGNSFTIKEIPYWVYYGSSAYMNCCFKCPIVYYPGKEECKKLLARFVEHCGFIPNQRFSPIERNFTCLLGAAKYTKTVRMLSEFGGYWHVIKLFGNWITALSESNVIDSLGIKRNRSYRCLAKDNHVCNSMQEMIIDNYLSDNSIDHIKEPRYPYHEVYNSSGLRRADWLINENVFVEFFGLSGDMDYDKKTSDKVNLCKELNLTLISIFPYDLNNLEDIFRSYKH